MKRTLLIRLLLPTKYDNFLTIVTLGKTGDNLETSVPKNTTQHLSLTILETEGCFWVKFK